jgi:hypothetical protein
MGACTIIIIAIEMGFIFVLNEVGCSVAYSFVCFKSLLGEAEMVL